MGLIRSIIGILFILGGIYRILLGIGLLFFGAIVQSFDPIGDPVNFLVIEGGDFDTGLLSLVGLGSIIIGGFFIWLGNVIRKSGQKTIKF